MISKNRSNGSAGHIAKSGANGSASHAGFSAEGFDSEFGGAGSVDVSELSVANTAAPSAAVGTGRTATADPAQPVTQGKQRRACGAASPVKARGKKRATPENENKFAEIPPGLEPLPVDAEAFVDAVHSEVDLVQLEVTLLHSKDEKVVQRELACLRELRYGKRAPSSEADESPDIIFDVPRPERDLP